MYQTREIFPVFQKGPTPTPFRHHGKWGDTKRAESGWEKCEDRITLANLW